ncbi:unnamed protein product [Soboliphyme baturini]|uniref:Uncharacterized protein n=1 Tax=Soboliphyme baturini TaxID=241478 RepID=A0A183IU25_9BILA|nr:unnamed protein product [Soboliphyme baturini]
MRQPQGWATTSVHCNAVPHRGVAPFLISALPEDEDYFLTYFSVVAIHRDETTGFNSFRACHLTSPSPSPSPSFRRHDPSSSPLFRNEIRARSVLLAHDSPASLRSARRRHRLSLLILLHSVPLMPDSSSIQSLSSLMLQLWS